MTPEEFINIEFDEDIKEEKQKKNELDDKFDSDIFSFKFEPESFSGKNRTNFSLATFFDAFDL